MSSPSVDESTSSRIRSLGDRVLAGGDVSREEALFLFNLESRADIFDLLSWANRIRERFKQNKIYLCSIVNVKAGGCPEDCRFCSQSAFYETDSPRYSLSDVKPVLEAAEEAARNHVAALGIVAAWRGIDEGAALDEICRQIEALNANGSVGAHASLGLIRGQGVAVRLAAAGLACYNHNLETSERFFERICTTHSYADRVATIRYLKEAGVKICSGGILGMGESREDRCDLVFALKELRVDIVPMNFLNPIPGTPFGSREQLSPLEILKSIACFRFILPHQEITIAGGRVVNLRDLQSLMFMAGASGLMVGNYLTTVNQPVEKDIQMLKDLGLEPRWGSEESQGNSNMKPVQAGANSPDLHALRPRQ